MVCCTSCHLHPTATALTLAVGGLFQSAPCGATAQGAGCPCSSADVHGCAWVCTLCMLLGATKAQRRHQEGLARVGAGWSLRVLWKALKCSVRPAELAGCPATKQGLFGVSESKICSSGTVHIASEI